MKRNILLFAIGFLVVMIGCFAAVLYIDSAIPTVSGNRTAPLVLIIDPGHGGEDGGASSAAGNKESDINLDIALKLESLLAFLGTETVLTRSDDISIYDEGCETLREKKVSDLKNRVSLIQSIPNAMLISIHQNTYTDSRYQGAHVFYGSGDVSRQWGAYTQDLFKTVLTPRNNRKAAGVPEHVYLFKHISCPAILVECGFLSNGEEASLLLTDTYQCKIAIILAGSFFHQLQMTPSTLGGD